jgi:uncharacterized protein (TIGR01777 family)
MSKRNHVFVKRVELSSNVEDVFEYHRREGALERLIPPWSSLRVIKKDIDLKDASIVILRLNVGPIGIRWIAQHSGYIQNRQFQDKMIKGPFRYWLHTHSFVPNEHDNCIMEDRIDYSLPFGIAGIDLFNNIVRKNLSQLFYYRHYILKNDMNLYKLVRNNRGKKILITGSTGLIGSALVPFLSTVGDHHVTRMVRPSSTYRNNDSYEVKWDPVKGKININKLEGYDIIIHLSGENIFGRWSDSKKRKLMESRIMTTRLLCDSLVKLKNPPSSLICASAIGIYGDKGIDVITEETPPAGSGFLSVLCQKWEEAAASVKSIGVRLINARFGMILTPKGGMLKKLVEPSIFKIGLRMGSENQYVSWISIEDVLGSILYSIGDSSIRGPVNIVSPNPMKMSDFTKILSNILKNKFIIPITTSTLKPVFGELADYVISSSSFVLPKRLSIAGYRFMNTDLENTLRLLLGRQNVICK